MTTNPEDAPVVDEQEFTPDFLDGIDPEEATKTIAKEINQIYKNIAHLVNYKSHLMIYRILKKGYATMQQMEDVTGYSRSRLYIIINNFEKREVERINNEETRA